jgi:2-polyprenyl-3-methyl-5-hydroxy-6-metoxy-1,4-benzoquinol methylase
VTLRRCLPCGVSLAWAWPSPAAYARLYTQGERYPVAEALRHGLPPHPARFAEHCRAAECRLRVLRDLAPGPDWLDVGAGNGAFVHTARAHGYAAFGLEPNAAAAARARAAGIPVSHGSWQHARGEWDLITLHDVLEHVTDPLACLRRLSRRLKPRGLLVVETPEWTPDRPEDWRHLKPREHLCLYSEAALLTLLRRAELRCGLVLRPVPDKLAVYAERDAAQPAGKAPSGNCSFTTMRVLLRLFTGRPRRRR